MLTKVIPFPRNHACSNHDGGFDRKLQIQFSPDWEWKNRLDVAAVQTQISSGATNRSAVGTRVYLHRHMQFRARVFATLILVAVAHGRGLLLERCAAIRANRENWIDRCGSTSRQKRSPVWGSLARQPGSAVFSMGPS
jgi:hypothetical protein